MSASNKDLASDLIVALQKGNLAKVKHFMELKDDQWFVIKPYEYDGTFGIFWLTASANTLLQWPVYKGDIDTFEYLINLKRGEDYPFRKHVNYYILYSAASLGDMKMLEYLSKLKTNNEYAFGKRDYFYALVGAVGKG